MLWIQSCGTEVKAENRETYFRGCKAETRRGGKGVLRCIFVWCFGCRVGGLRQGQKQEMLSHIECLGVEL